MVALRWSALVGILLFSAAVQAQEERSIDHFAGVGVRAMGMGGAYTGVADDLTAMYWNPAGLAQITRNQVDASLQRSSRTNHATLGGTRALSSLDNTRLNTLGVVMPYPVYRGSLVFAVGTLRLRDFDWSLRQRGFDSADSLYADFHFQHEGGIMLTGVAAAADISPFLSLGATLGITRGDDKATDEYTWVDSEDLYTEKRWLARESFDDDYHTCLHAVVGAMLRAPRKRPRLRLGAAVSFGGAREIAYTFHGLSDAQGYNVIEYDDGTVRQNVVVESDGSVSQVRIEEHVSAYKLSLPVEFSLGGSVAPLPGVLLAAGVHLAEWTQTTYKGADPYQLRGGESFRTQYRDVARYHLGVEWQVPVIALDLRAGYYTDPLPFLGPRDPDLLPDPQTNPRIRIDDDRRFYTMGAGLLVDRVLRLDVAWIHGRFQQTEGGLTEKNTVDRVLTSLAYRF